MPARRLLLPRALPLYSPLSSGNTVPACKSHISRAYSRTSGPHLLLTLLHLHTSSMLRAAGVLFP